MDYESGEADVIYETAELIEDLNWTSDGNWLIFNADGRILNFTRLATGTRANQYHSFRGSKQQACLDIWIVDKSISGNETGSWYRVAIDKETRNVPLISMRQLTRIFPC